MLLFPLSLKVDLNLKKGGLILMNNGSKTYKVLRIVFLTLAIISLVFTLYKK